MDFQFKRKIVIKADMKILTGLHIGTSNAYSAIGTVDSSVIRSVDGNPIVPGSSLKGKIRTLLASVKDSKDEYSDIKKDNYVIKRLFGVPVVNDSDKKSPAIVSRLQFSDAYVSNSKEKSGLLTEVKFENTIDRGTCKATPRQIERVAPGVVFQTVIVYNEFDEQETKEDLETLAEGMKLLQYDYLGGHGTRGYGRVKFENIRVEVVNGEDSDKEILKGYFEKVEKGGLLSL